MQSIQCLLCRQIITAGMSASQGIALGDTVRGHLISVHAESAEGQAQLMEHMKRVSWLMDLLAFDSPDDPLAYRELLHQAVDQLLVPQSLLEVVPS